MDNADGLSPREIRIVQAAADFAMALSAFDFMSEPEPDQQMTRIERRRLRCFEDAAVVAYWRPFSKSRGLPVLTFETLGIEPTSAQLALHDRIHDRRDKVVAHSDIERMRLVFTTRKFFRDKELLLPHHDFDDALHFFNDRNALIDWLRTLRQAVGEVIFDMAQGRPEITFKRDHEASDDQG